VRVPLDFSDGSVRKPLVPLIEFEEASSIVKEIYKDMMAFYQMERVPNIFKVLARDEGYLRDYWGAVRFVFESRHLDRLTKEVLALAASMAVKSDYGVDLHLREVRRLGLSEKGILEVIQIVQVFSCYTKIADGLQLDPDFTELLHKAKS
jgi:alkylhydroperoxidase/carboxymuconolactone decarboxylase family protein YurZ